MRDRIRKLRAELRALFRDQPKEQLEQLASEIVEYGRMNAMGPGIVVIEVLDVAYRLRESPRHVRQSLRLLEMKGIAKKTNFKDYWRLSA